MIFSNESDIIQEKFFWRIQIMAKRVVRTEYAARNDLVRLCCYIALVLAGVLLIITNFLPVVGVEIKGKFLSVMVMIKDIALLLGIVFAAYSFARSHGKTTTIIFWIALVLYVACVICGLF